MNLRVITWNIRRATKESLAWQVIRELDPEILILQEVNSIPENIKDHYSYLYEKAISKSGKLQKFGTAILCKGKINNKIHLKSEFEWANKELDILKGNLLGCNIEIKNNFFVNIISVYSPAWPIEHERLDNIDISKIKLTQNPKLWGTEILWAGLKNELNLNNENWIVAGDFNSSVTFDYLWGTKPRGNQEIIDRMNSIGLKESLQNYTGKLTPTFRNSKGGKVIHQIDHMYLTNSLISCVSNSFVGDSNNIFKNSISDHLPIITDFEL